LFTIANVTVTASPAEMPPVNAMHWLAVMADPAFFPAAGDDAKVNGE